MRKTAADKLTKNPLFVEWLTEWKTEAASRELKSQYTYAKVGLLTIGVT